MSNARSRLIAVLAPLDAHEMDAERSWCECMESSLQAFDELDTVRLAAWQTVSNLKPKFPRPRRVEVPSIEQPRTLEDFVATLSHSADEGGCPVLSLTDAGVSSVDPPEEQHVDSEDLAFTGNVSIMLAIPTTIMSIRYYWQLASPCARLASFNVTERIRA